MVTAGVVVVRAVVESAVKPMQDGVLMVGFNGQLVLKTE